MNVLNYSKGKEEFQSQEITIIFLVFLEIQVTPLTNSLFFIFAFVFFTGPFLKQDQIQSTRVFDCVKRP